MTFWQAIRNLLQGQKVTRPALEGQYILVLSQPANTAPDFFLCDDNVHSKTPFEPSEEDMAAMDWTTL